MKLASAPYESTGPAIENILTPTPKIKPSGRNSIAGDTMEFAKPVIGTSVPAPPKRAILSYMPSIVKTAEIKMSVTEVSAKDKSFDEFNIK